ncbi:hypothetical protein LR48_Vigan98s000800 [Vigna angularis]|uniref:Uncharacterized protein n=1 Tax=Phaseolus angularis TaxID=3914 RepID=A0A0L9T4R0_PHAAN|nr:hypothetical protein LR48_Vigan98s000800 [Vigna angularis]
MAIIKEVLLSAFVRVKSMGKRPPPAGYLPETTSRISFSIMKPPFSLSNKGLLKVRALSPDKLRPALNRGLWSFSFATNTLETTGPYGATPLRSEAIPARTNWVFALTNKDNIRTGYRSRTSASAFETSTFGSAITPMLPKRTFIRCDVYRAINRRRYAGLAKFNPSQQLVFIGALVHPYASAKRMRTTLNGGWVGESIGRPGGIQIFLTEKVAEPRKQPY